MPGLSRSALAREVGVSRQGVHQAVKRGVLRMGADGLIDVNVEPNKSWVGLHAAGVDWRGRSMSTYARGEETEAPAPPGLFEDWDSVPIDEAAADRLLAVITDGGDPIPLIVAMLEALRRATAEQLEALREELAEVRALAEGARPYRRARSRQ